MESNLDTELKVLFYEYHSSLVLFALKFTGDVETARDIVQETFLSFWENAEKIHEKKAAKTYLFQTVRNKSLNHIRHINVEHSFEKQLLAQINDAEKYIYFDFHNPYHSLVEKELQNKIETIYASLPQKCREVFILSRSKQLKNKAIAKELGISIKMVEKQISKALMIFRRELKNSWGIVQFISFFKNLN